MAQVELVLYPLAFHCVPILCIYPPKDMPGEVKLRVIINLLSIRQRYKRDVGPSIPWEPPPSLPPASESSTYAVILINLLYASYFLLLL